MANPSNITKHQYAQGHSGNPKGRPKGSRNLSSVIKLILEEDMDWDKLPSVSSAKMSVKHSTSGWEAIIYVAAAKALEGNIQAMEWLRKAAYGNQVDLISSTQSFLGPTIYIPKRDD